MSKLTDKKVYITGGSSGIGLETARQVASLGAHVVIIARNPEKLETARQEIEGLIINHDQVVAAVSLDVGDNDKVESILQATVKEFGAPDILVANAGVGYGDYFENISYDTFDWLMKINVYGVRNTIAALLPAMKKKGGKIAILSSMAGIAGVFGYTAYGTSKFALVGFAECLRPELKPYGIDVTLICPPEVDTPFLVEEAKTLPPETRALKDSGGLMTVEETGKAIIKALTGKKFTVIPGMKTKLAWLMLRFLPERLVHAANDAIVRKAAGYQF